MIRPKIHKIYGDYLFEQKHFMKASRRICLFRWNFEHVCLKFLCTNNNLALLKYLLIVYNFKKSRDFIQIIKDKRKDKDYFDILIHYYYIIY